MWNHPKVLGDKEVNYFMPQCLKYWIWRISLLYIYRTRVKTFKMSSVGRGLFPIDDTLQCFPLFLWEKEREIIKKKKYVVFNLFFLKRGCEFVSFWGNCCCRKLSFASHLVTSYYHSVDYFLREASYSFYSFVIKLTSLEKNTSLWIRSYK